MSWQPPDQPGHIAQGSFDSVTTSQQQQLQQEEGKLLYMDAKEGEEEGSGNQKRWGAQNSLVVTAPPPRKKARPTPSQEPLKPSSVARPKLLPPQLRGRANVVTERRRS